MKTKKIKKKEVKIEMETKTIDEPKLRQELKQVNKSIFILSENNKTTTQSKEEKTLWNKKREILAKLNPLNK